MTRKYDGGPAFPQDEFYEEKHIGQHPGMLLRDYMAGQALVGMMVRPSFWSSDEAKKTAAAAYEIADAMLAERNK